MVKIRRPWFVVIAIVMLAALGLPLAGQTTAPVKSQAAAQAPAAAAAATSARTAPLTQAIPVDPLVTVGRFPNGLRYLIRTNKLPANRAELRLVVNAGSILENDDQQGLAHFVEHMAFNGTSHFPKQQLIDFLQSTGMKFGPSINAFTSFDETVYMLQIPTDKAGLLEKAFLILEDWARNVSFDPTEIDKERGVIIEEWRGRRGAAARIQDKQLPVMLKGSRYAVRLPIGKTEIIQNFKHDLLKTFYTDWYRPDLMTVVAVGDIDKAAVEAMITQHFKAIPPATAPRARAAYAVPDTPGTLYSIETDKEMTGTTVGILNKLPARDHTTVGAYRQEIVESLFDRMLNVRFSELAQKPDPPFVGGGASIGPFGIRGKEAASLNAMVKETGIERGIEVLLTEALRVARHGFTPSEFDRQKKDMLRGIEQQATEKDKQQSAMLANEYMRHALVQEPIPGIVYEYELYQRFLPEITLAEINALATKWLAESNRVVMVSGPQKEGLVVPDEARLAGVINAVGTKEVTAYVDTSDSKPLLDPIPSPGRVVKASTREGIGLTEWELSNGIKVALKPTDFKQDEIVFRAFSPGGTSLASDKDYVAAMTASQAVGAGGVGQFSAIELRKVLSGKVASANAGFSDLSSTVFGSGSRKDLETMFQLIYMAFTQPRSDPAMFGVITNQMKTILANRKNTPDYAFSEALSQIMSQGHIRGRTMSPELVDEMNLEKSLAFYKERMADASGFTFVFAGSFDLDTMKPLVERYLASLPSADRRETWKDVGMRLPKGVIEKTVEKGIEQKSRVALVFTGPFEWTQPNRIAIRSMASVLDNRLRETLREDLSGTYGVSVSANYNKTPRSEYSLSINFTCSPARVEELVKAMLKEIDGLKASGPSEKHTSDVKETMLRDYETNMKQNSYVMGQLYARYESGEDPAGIFALAEFYNKLDGATIQQAAKTYLDANNYVKVVLMPEKKQ
jgi:zinc protease